MEVRGFKAIWEFFEGKPSSSVNALRLLSPRPCNNQEQQNKDHPLDPKKNDNPNGTPLAASEVITFSASLSGCAKASRWRQALHLFQLVPCVGLQRNVILSNTMLNGMEKGQGGRVKGEACLFGRCKSIEDPLPIDPIHVPVLFGFDDRFFKRLDFGVL